MNSKFLFIIILFAVSCGLKTKPKAPAGTDLPSIQDSYSVKYQGKKPVEEEKKKKK